MLLFFRTLFFILFAMPTAKRVTTTRKTATRKPSVKKDSAASKNTSTERADSQVSPFSKFEVLPKKTKLIILTILGAVLLGIIIFLNRSLFVASVVNGEPISRLEVIRELEKQQGASVLGRLIDRKLILQESEKNNIEVTQDEIDKKKKEIIQQVSNGDEANFAEILKSQGLSDEQFIEELRVQIMVEKMLSKNTEVTDEEFNKFLESNPDLLENSENQDETRAQLKEQLKQQKLQTEYTTWMENLRKNGDVIRFVSY